MATDLFNKQQIFKCLLCEKFQALSIRLLLNHYRCVHANESSFSVRCNISNCPAVFKLYNSLYKHVTRKHSEIYNNNVTEQNNNSNDNSDNFEDEIENTNHSNENDSSSEESPPDIESSSSTSDDDSDFRDGINLGNLDTLDVRTLTLQ